MKQKILAFIVAEATRAKRGKESPLPQLKSAPHYLEKNVPVQQILGNKKIKIDGREIELTAKSYPDAILVEAVAEVVDIFDSGILEWKDKLHEACYEYAKKQGANIEVAEEYSIYEVSGYEGHTLEYLNKYGRVIVTLLKSERITLSDKEVENVLAYRLKYGEGDVVVVDWDGAFALDRQGGFEETAELIELANYQLLRYRMFDADIDKKIDQVSKFIKDEKPRQRFVYSKNITKEIKELITLRAGSVAKFEAIDRDIKLIGEWYSAKLYELMYRRLRLGEWHALVKEKLKSLEDIYSIASESLGFSRVQRLELIQITAFFILQIGWFVLIILELIQLFKK